MLRHSTNLTRNGLTDWLLQRASAVLLAAYTVFIFAFIIAADAITFEVWSALFSQTWMKVFTLLTLFGLVAHAWIGMWTVFTDYVKPLGLRLLLTIGLFILLFSYFVGALLCFLSYY